MKKIIVLMILAFMMSACQPEVVVVTATQAPTQSPTDTATPVPTVETTPTQEVPTIDENAINPNAAFSVGCSTIYKDAKFAGREVCQPLRWDWNRLNFANNPADQPPPDVAFIQGAGANGSGNYLNVRIDYLTSRSQYCLAQYENFLRDTDDDGNQLNYVLKAGLDLRADDMNSITIPSVEIQITTDSGNTYLQEEWPNIDEKLIDPGYNEYIWVIDPLDSIGVHYQWCFNFRGIQGGNNFIRIYELSMLEASGSWGLDVETQIE